MSQEKVTPEMVKFALRVVVLRAERGWTQDTLAYLAGLHRNYIGHIERAELNIGLRNLVKLARAFEMSVGELIKGL